MSIPMSDSVLAAIIAGTATLSASLLQLRSALLRDAARGGSAARRKNRVQKILLLVVVGAAAVGGFALSQWLNSGERLAQKTLQQELQARVAEISRTASQLELTRAGARAEIETGVLRQLGANGVVITATVAACRPALVISAPGSASPPGLSAPPPAAGRACTEAEASPVTLCATIPASARITEVELFSRLADSDAPWSANRFVPGQESGQARFTEKYSQMPPEGGTQQVCQGFAHWSAEHARSVRMVVRYTL
ncbi:MAG TPA: hypothetical protein VH111_05660 [Steroidobacteraceae bacterium]|nr:hypothetical protein [Steroidobacteraceae bacterium]